MLADLSGFGLQQVPLRALKLKRHGEMVLGDFYWAFA
jgi:hypothetical protein